MRGNLPIRFLRRLRPAAIVVPELVGSEVTLREPGAGFQSDDLEPRLRQRERGDASDRAEADNDDVGFSQSSRHG